MQRSNHRCRAFAGDLDSVLHSAAWIGAQRKSKQRLALDEFNRLGGKASAQRPLVLPDSPGKLTLATAAEKYFANCEAHGLDPESIRKYRARGRVFGPRGAAAKLGIPRSTLEWKIRSLKIDKNRFRIDAET